MNLETYCLTIQSQNYDGHISGKIGKWAKRIDFQMNSSKFNPSEPISVVAFLHKFRTACDNKTLHEGAAN